MFRKPQKTPLPVKDVDNQKTEPQTTILQERLRKTLCTLATETWRMKRKIIRMKTSELLSDEIDGMTVSINRMESGLKDISIEYREYTNQQYDSGMNLKVLAYEQVEESNISNEFILQTVAPSIFFMGQQIQQGEVIVASNKLTGDIK
jgi:hypothetical protein